MVHLFLYNYVQKVQQHLWRTVQKSSHVNKYVMLNLWDTLEGRKKRKKQKARVIRLTGSWRKEIGWSKVKISWLAFTVTWCEECEREKRRKRWRNKERGHSAREDGEKRSEVLECEDWCSLEELREWEQVKEEKNREGKRKYTLRKRAVSEKKNRVFLYLSCISKYCNLYLI